MTELFDPNRQRCLGLDLGDRRIGVALGSAGVATPLTTIVRARSGAPGRARTTLATEHREIIALCREWEIEAVVVGDPVSLAGRRETASKKVAKERELLEGALACRVYAYDERLTTALAHRSLDAMAMRSIDRRKVVDQLAAVEILQGWLDAQKRS